MNRILLIAGWGRSGSTILANVLGSAPGIETLGEINNIWDRGFGQDLLCSCGAPFHVCPLWEPIAYKAFGSEVGSVADRARHAGQDLGNTWLMQRRIPGLKDRHTEGARSYGELLSALYSAAAEHTGASLLVDASKSPWHCAIADSLDNFDVSILHLIRDPRGVAYSLGKTVEYQTAGAQIQMDRHGATTSSLAWIYRNRLVEWEWRNRPNYLQMRYEDFISDPQQAVARIMTLVGMGDSEVPFVGPKQVDIAPSHNISGNPVRFHNGAVTLRADDKWRKSLPTLTRNYVRWLTWPHMSHFGY